MKKCIYIESCSNCPHHLATEYPTADSFERPEYWWCKNPDVKEENRAMDAEGERHRKGIKGSRSLEKLSYVAGYVEWHDKTEIPDWCPLPNAAGYEWKEYDNPVRGDMDPQSWGDDTPEPRREMGG